MSWSVMPWFDAGPAGVIHSVSGGLLAAMAMWLVSGTENGAT